MDEAKRWEARYADLLREHATKNTSEAKPGKDGELFPSLLQDKVRQLELQLVVKEAEVTVMTDKYTSLKRE